MRWLYSKAYRTSMGAKLSSQEIAKLKRKCRRSRIQHEAQLNLELLRLLKPDKSNNRLPALSNRQFAHSKVAVAEVVEIVAAAEEVVEIVAAEAEVAAVDRPSQILFSGRFDFPGRIFVALGDNE